jgi:hypothetical protein
MARGKKRGGKNAKKTGKKILKGLGGVLGASALLALAHPDVRGLVRGSYNLDRQLKRRQMRSNPAALEMTNFAKGGRRRR